MPSKKRLLIAVIPFLCLLTAGCSDDEPDSDSNTDSTAPAENDADDGEDSNGEPPPGALSQEECDVLYDEWQTERARVEAEVDLENGGNIDEFLEEAEVAQEMELELRERCLWTIDLAG